MKPWWTPHRLYHGWIVVAGLAVFGIGLGAALGVGWATVANGFLLGFAIGNIGLVKQMRLTRDIHESHMREIEALMAMNHNEIGRAIAEHIAREVNGEPEQRTLQ